MKILTYFKKRRNKTFYLTVTSQFVIVLQLFFVMIGQGDLVTAALQHNIIAFVDGLLLLLGTLGVVNDPTNPGLTDKEEK